METLSTQPASPRPLTLRDRRLGQIYRRDPKAEGRFWYSVVTTGVYCRPTCPSRRAHAENIRLHDTLAQARATGFRPCRRCRPEAPSLNERHRVLIAVVCRAIETGDAPPFGVLARTVGLSPGHLHRLFRRLTGTTPSAYARRSRAGAVTPSPVRTGARPAEPRSIDAGQEPSE